jgi:hemerythrin-like domain-containing protein
MNNTIQKIDVAALVAELDAAREYIKQLLEELRQAREHGKELTAIVRDLATYAEKDTDIWDLVDRARAALEPK